MPKQPKANEVTIHQFCAGGGCCPVLHSHPDRHVEIVDEGKSLLRLRPKDADELARLLTRLGYGDVK